MILDCRPQDESYYCDMQSHIHSTTQTSITKPGSRIFIKHLLSSCIPLFLLDNERDRATQNCVNKVMAIYISGKNKLLSRWSHTCCTIVVSSRQSCMTLFLVTE